MKKTIVSCLLSALFLTTSAQFDRIFPLPGIQDTNAFKARLQTIVDQIGNHRIVALGEATHGTKEFTLLRHALTQLLVEQKGFNIICLENPYGDTYLLDSLLNTPDRNKLMRETLLAIYQTTEFNNFLSWLQADHRATLRGIDFVEITASAKILRAGLQHPSLNRLTDSIVQRAAFQDSIWLSFNKRGFKYDPKAVVLNAYYMYRQLDKLEQLCAQHNVHLSEQVQTTILACRHGVENLYQTAIGKKGRSRDEHMAEMVNRLAEDPNAKIIVWAHNAHIAYESGFKDSDNAGGMGQFIKEKHPDYFAIGTSTAAGTYSATKDRFDTKWNRFSSYKLQRARDNSWEAYFATLNSPAFYILTKDLEPANRVHKLVGYRPESKSLSSNYTAVAIQKLYDAVIFFKETTAANHELQ